MHDAEVMKKLAEIKYKNIDLNLEGLEMSREKILVEGHWPSPV